MCSWKRFAYDLLFSLRFEGEPSSVSAGAGEETGSGERVETVARRRLEGVWISGIKNWLLSAGGEVGSVQLLSAVEVLIPTNEEGAVVAIDWSTGLVPFSSKIWLAARTRRGSRVDRLPLFPEAFRDKGKGRGGRGASCREDEAKFIRASSTTSEQILRTLDFFDY